MIKPFTQIQKKIQCLIPLFLILGHVSFAQNPSVKGIVKDDKGALPNATISAQNDANTASALTYTDKNGVFTFPKLNPGKYKFIIKSIGFETKTIFGEVKKDVILSVNVLLKESVTTLGQDVIVTGMTTRKKESFTGATATFSGEQLKQLGNQNILQSLKTLDPSILQIENTLSGSDPNVLPNFELRGQTSIETTALRDAFSSNPNLPLFILDGFETSLRIIIDLDMNTIASITILKDAASTSMYGSRASNGVIVVETKKPMPGKLRFSYTSDLNVEIPDLTSYNLMNAAEKLEFERLSRRYVAPVAVSQLTYDSLYNSKLRDVKRGVNTYWLQQPLRTGFSIRHSVTAGGGDNNIRYDIGANTKTNNATMIGSKRNDWGANFNLTYRTGKINVSNRIYVNGSNNENSPYGSFTVWARVNPYYTLPTTSQKYLENNIIARTVNPLYNASLNSYSKGNNFNLMNNFQVDVSLTTYLRVQFNGQINKNSSEDVSFVSPLNVMYDNLTDQTLKGRYTNSRTNSLDYNANINLTYNRIFNKKHSVTAFLRGELVQRKNTAIAYNAVGFPNASNGNPSFAYGFETGSKPSAPTTLVRRSSLGTSINYSYAGRYNLDLNYTLNGSTVFGSNERFNSFYSGGISWNLNNEKFLSKLNWISILRIRGNIGVTGNENFGNISESTYSYLSAINGFGQGAVLSILGAPDLKPQNTIQASVGIDANLFNNKLDFQFNAYQKITNPLAIGISVPLSTGITQFPFNLGISTVKGAEAIINFSPIYQPGKFTWTLGATASAFKQKYGNFRAALSSLNNSLKASTSSNGLSNNLKRYQDGYSSYDLWTVPSFGIDPATGKEVFLKKNGQQTFNYDPNDEVVVASSNPIVEGVLKTTLAYKQLTFGVYIRYIIGRSKLNTDLFEKVENIELSDLQFNQDRRALYDRWQNPGDISPFKNIASSSLTRISSRFVQKETVFNGESINVGYTFSKRKWLDKAALSALVLNGYLNNVFYASNIRLERGIDYPFARSFSISLRATLK